MYITGFLMGRGNCPQEDDLASKGVGKGGDDHSK